jgi:hypothetical protein
MSVSEWTPQAESRRRREAAVAAFDRSASALEDLTEALRAVVELQDPAARPFDGCRTATRTGRAVRAAVAVMLDAAIVRERSL